MRYATILILLSTMSLTGSAQTWASRVTVAINAGTTVGGPTDEIETHMIASGFGKSQECFLFCSGTISYPMSYGGSAWGIKVDYHLSRLLTASIDYSVSDLGETIGHAADFGSRVALRKSMKSYELMLSVGTPARYPPRRLSLGIGPAIYRTSISTSSQTSLGLVIGGQLRAPLRRFYFEAGYTYRLLGKHAYGPFDVAFRDNSWRLPESEAGFTSSEFSLGVGFRLGPKTGGGAGE